MNRGWWWRVARAMAATAVVVVSVSGVAAQQSQDWMPVENVTQETLPAVPLVYAAYAFAWVVIMAYAFMLWRKLGRVEKDLADVNARLQGRKP